MSEQFSLEARLDFIVSGIGEALQLLDGMEGRLNAVVTGLAEMDEAQRGAAGSTEKHQKAILDVSDSLDKFRQQVGGLTGDMAAEEDAVVRGSAAWQDRVRALSAAQRMYATFRKNELTGAETGDMLDPNSQSGQAQRDDLATLAAKKANYASTITQAARDIESAEKRIKAATDANNYDKQVAELGAVAAATNRLTAANKAYFEAKSAEARLEGSDASLLAEARARTAVADAIEEQRAAQAALNSAQKAEMAAASRPAPADKFLGMNTGSLPRVRYAMYDVSFAAGIMGAALVGAFGAAAGAAISYEADFAQVVRTTGIASNAAAELREEFTALSTSMPVGFGDLSSIGALGGQLNVAAEDLANFARVTAQFSATTNVTIDAAGTAMGRLDQLINNSSGEYEALASSILKVGVNSVATESAIIAISQNIAGIAASVGLTTDEVIGLAGAMASIGTAPEAARSTITRLFSNLQVAIELGGSQLETFSALVGMTGEQFKQAWGEDAGGTLIKMLESINIQGESAIGKLAALGITSRRDVPTLLKLAQNTDVLASSLSDASSGFSDADELATQYGITADTLSAKISILGNSVMGLFAAMGGSVDGPMNDVIEGLTDFIGMLAQFASTDAGQAFFFISLSLAAIAGSVALAGAGIARFLGSMLATQTLVAEFTAARRAKAAAEIADAVATNQNTAAMNGNTAATRINAAATRDITVATKAATAATALWKGALISTGIGAAVVLIGTLTAALMANAEASADAAEQAEAYFGGKPSGLATALIKDQVAFEETGESIRKINVEVEESRREAAAWVDSLEGATGAQVRLNDGTTTTTDSIRAQTIAYGENARAALAAALANAEGFQELFKPDGAAQALQGFGFNGSKFADAILGDPVEGGRRYAERLLGEMAAQANVSKEDVRKVLEGLNDPNMPARNKALLASAYNIPGDVMANLRRAAGAYAEVVAAADSASGVVQSQGAAAAAAAAANEALGIGALGAADGVDGMAGALDGAIDVNIAFAEMIDNQIQDVMAAGVANERLGQGLNTLGQAFASNGATAAISGSAMSAVLQNIASQADTGPQAAARMSVFFSAIVAGGYASVEQLSSLIATMSALTGATVVATQTGANVNAMLAALKAGSDSAAKGIGGVGSAAKSAAKELRTLVDYGNDLAGVFSRMSDIRFGPQAALDSITSGWNSLKQEAEDAKQAIDDAAEAIDDAARKAAKANATIVGLNAEKSNLEYWLNVAKMYDDAERVKQIEAELAQNASKTADAEDALKDAQKEQTKAAKDLSKAQDAASTSLTGNSQAAVDNRKALTDMVSDYQALIETYAASGMPADQLKAKTAELKEEFIRQATALGFSRDEVLGYAASFDDMAKAIDNVPRNITVGLDITGVDAAIAELNAKLAQANAGSGGGGGGGGGGGFDLSSLLDLLIPDEGPTIVFNGDTRLVGDALKDLYAQVEAAKPTITINGESVPAVSVLRQTIEAIQRGEGTVRINGEALNAEDVLQDVLLEINKSVGSVTINGETIGAGNALAILMSDVNASKASVTIDGKKQPAEKVLALTLEAIGRGEAKVKIGGTSVPVDKALADTLSAINKSTASTKINADITGANSTMASLLRRIANAEVYVGVGIRTNAGLQGQPGQWAYDTGGYTGPGGKYDVAGIVHRDEYVFPKEAVRYYGVENLAHMHQRALRGYSSGGPVGGTTPGAASAGAAPFASQMSASDRAFFTELFREFAGSLTVTDGVIAQAANAANRRLVKSGAN